MSDQRILIVGAGALGITTAWFLQLSGAEISFLVRPHRVEALSRPQRMYSYNDHTIKTLERYALYSGTEELTGKQFDFVLLTLDGAACRSDDGIATLRGLGQALAGSDAILMICGVGIGLYDHIRQTTGYPDSQLMRGTMGMYAYQVGRAEMPLPPPADRQRHDSADIAWFYMPKGTGFMVSSTPGTASKAFAELYNHNGFVRCNRVPTKMYEMFTNSYFPFTIASELDGWQGVEHLVNNKALWHLCCQSQREIMGLKQHGLFGKIVPLFMTDGRWAKTALDMDEASRPIDGTAFNKFHHGGKVLEQDVQVVENCLAAGVKDGREMGATRDLLAKWRNLRGL